MIWIEKIRWKSKRLKSAINLENLLSLESRCVQERLYGLALEMLERHFWDVFVVDALLGNFDRHNGNWGFLFDEITGESSIVPIYDCGNCLLPQQQNTLSKDAEKPAKEIYDLDVCLEEYLNE